MMLLGFRTAGGADWECTLGFDRFDYANISFFDASGADILFHLSFRLNGQTMGVNRRIADAWDTEALTPCALDREFNRLNVTFDATSVTVSLNGDEVYSHHEDDGLPAISQFDLHGGVSGVRFGGTANADLEACGELRLVQPFTLAGWGLLAGAADQVLRIEIPHLADGLPLQQLPRTDLAEAAGVAQDRLGVSAVLPGRVWTGVPEGEGLTLQLTCNGRACAAPLVIDREQLAETIEAIAANEAAGAFDLVSAVEHATLGGVIPMLSEGTRRLLSRVVDGYALSELLNPEALVLDGDADFSPDLDTDADVDAVEAVQKQFARRLRLDDALSPAEALALPEIGDMVAALSSLQQRLLVMRLAEVFAVSDQLEALVELSDSAGLRDQSAALAPWERTFRLPFDLLAGDGDAVLDFFQWLGERPEGWLSTATLGWSIRRIVSDCPLFLSDTERETAARAFVDYVDWIAWDYWGRAACVHVTEALVHLLENADLFSTWFKDWLIEKTLQSHWLSPNFWQRINASEQLAGLREDGRIHAALAAFEAAMTAVKDGSTGSGLTALPPSKAIDGERLMRELAPIGWTGDRLAALDPHRIRDLSLRRAALPGGNSTEAGPPEQVSRAIRSLSPMLAHSEYLDLQDRASRRAAALLTTPASETAPTELQNLAREFRILSCRRSNFVGVALALNLTSGLIRAGQSDLAETAAALSRSLIEAVPEVETSALPVSPAVRMAVFGLRQTGLATGSTLALDLVSMLPEAEGAVPVAAETSTEALLPRDSRSVFFDTVVVVFSCRPLLDTRVKAQRETWLKDLAAQGIPYLIVVGDGDDIVDGDVLHLDAPDSYEGLPRKVLAAIRWIYRNTPFSHMMKIDDDCFVDVERFFHSQSYRKFAYYGRRLHRTAGQTDRTWHLTRASTARDALEIDKSPEPSTYAEGGTGYVLNRAIMDLLIHNADTPEGARLILTSIMEDKLIGDLLGLTGVVPDSEDYNACVLRRSHSGGHPVSRWENAFLPSKASPAKLVHLDTPDLMQHAARVAESNELWPKKAWPSYAPARIGWNTNAIELISPVERLEAVNAQDLVVISCVRNELGMLPMFLEHYRKLGVRGFFVIDNLSTDGTLEYLLEQPDVATFSADTDYSASAYGVAWQQAAMSNFRLNRWSLIADADELFVLGSGETSLPTLLNGADFVDVDAARVFMLDLYPDGPLSEASFDGGDPFSVATHVDKVPFLAESVATGPFSNAETWTSSLRHRLLPGSRSELFVAQKNALVKYRPWMRLSAGLHYIAEARVCERDFIFAHFKYHAGFQSKVQEETRRRQHFNDAEEYRQYRNLMAEGRDLLFNPEISVPWRDCDWVRERLD